MEGCLVGQGGASELELQTKVADFERLWRLTAREQNDVARLLRELKSKIKAEVAALRSGSQTDGEAEKTRGGDDDDETWPRGK